MPTRVWFETHSTTTDNELRLATGWLPGELSDTGREQALALGARIAERRPSVILTSDLRRATETVRLALTQAGLTIPVVQNARLRECDYGDLNGAPHGQVHHDRLRYLGDPYPGGESWRTALDRCEVGLREAIAQHEGSVIMIIGHVATRLAVERLATGRPIDQLLIMGFSWQPGWLWRV